MSQKIEKTTKKIHIQNAGGEAGRPENKKVIRRIHRYLYHSLSDFHKSSIREVKLKIKHYKQTTTYLAQKKTAQHEQKYKDHLCVINIILQYCLAELRALFPYFSTFFLSLGIPFACPLPLPPMLPSLLPSTFSSSIFATCPNHRSSTSKLFSVLLISDSCFTFYSSQEPHFHVTHLTSLSFIRGPRFTRIGKYWFHKLFDYLCLYFMQDFLST